jgi:hypothetical protein
MISFQVVNNIAIPTCFIFTSIKKKEIVALISTLQMIQTPSPLKSKVEIVLDVSHFDFVPHMAIMLPIHSLHLAKLIIKIDNVLRGRGFKQNITIKCGWNTMILNLLTFSFHSKPRSPMTRT